ncbi:glycoside hydrolase family 3 N-terminal domain-containing protein [Streptomyces sp. NPDC090052]|uniref:glycoside hydrolase family 3 N-terminal domain-containing protein n=1 Tax=Streptomyces sp. NPDC090052 TaxID=3365931 RepID=UPI0037FFB0BA
MRTTTTRVLLGACFLSLTSICVPAHAAPPLSPSASAGSVPVYLNTRYSFAERAADLVSRMTLAEKAVQLNSDGIEGIPRLGVQAYSYGSEGQHGINDLGNDTNPGPTDGGAHKPVHATSFPSNFASPMSWDQGLMYEETTAISDEARGFLDKSLWNVGQNDLGPSAADYGALVYWAPNVNMDRDPRWGRTNEAFGEDPYLVSQMAGAYVNGDQGQTPQGKPTSKYLKVAATAKHYALYDVESNRFASNSVAKDADIHNYYTAPFKSLIEKSHVAGLMTAYDEVNGTPTVAHTYLNNQMAQRSYGFSGYTTSDCGGVETVYGNGSSGANWAPPGWTTDKGGRGGTWTNTATGQQIPAMAGGQAWALRGGTDSNCGGPEANLQNMEAAIKAGVLSEGVIDNALVRMFTVRMKTGEFDDPGKILYTKITKDVIQSPTHQKLAEKVADNSLVLLKNDKVTGAGKPLLPADPAELHKVVVVGDMADKVDKSTLGGYSSDPSLKVSAVKGITDQVKAANPTADVVFDAAGTSVGKNAKTPAVLSTQTQADIKSADLVVVFVGNSSEHTLEGTDRTDLRMPGNYGSLVDQVTALGNPRTALAIPSDGPVKIDDVRTSSPPWSSAGTTARARARRWRMSSSGSRTPAGGWTSLGTRTNRNCPR